MKKKIATGNTTTMNMEEKEMKIDTKICECCGKEIAIEDAKLAHRIPLSEGGKNNFSNMVILCKNCFCHTQDYEIEYMENRKKARAIEDEQIAKLEAEEEAAEQAMREKIFELVDQFFMETREKGNILWYLCIDTAKRDYLYRLFSEDCCNSLSFIEFFLDRRYIDNCWDEFELSKYALNEGFDYFEATLFAETFSNGAVRDWLDFDIAQAVFEYIMYD